MFAHAHKGPAPRAGEEGHIEDGDTRGNFFGIVGVTGQAPYQSPTQHQAQKKVRLAADGADGTEVRSMQNLTHGANGGDWPNGDTRGGMSDSASPGSGATGLGQAAGNAGGHGPGRASTGLDGSALEGTTGGPEGGLWDPAPGAGAAGAAPTPGHGHGHGGPQHQQAQAQGRTVGMGMGSDGPPQAEGSEGDGGGGAASPSLHMGPPGIDEGNGTGDPDPSAGRPDPNQAQTGSDPAAAAAPGPGGPAPAPGPEGLRAILHELRASPDLQPVPTDSVDEAFQKAYVFLHKAHELQAGILNNIVAQTSAMYQRQGAAFATAAQRSQGQQQVLCDLQSHRAQLSQSLGVIQAQMEQVQLSQGAEDEDE